MFSNHVSTTYLVLGSLHTYKTEKKVCVFSYIFYCLVLNNSEFAIFQRCFVTSKLVFVRLECLSL